MAKQTILVSEVTPNMKLAEPIVNASGMTMIPRGVRLTPIFISRLVKWGIVEVEILVEDSAGQAQTSTSRRGKSTTTSTSVGGGDVGADLIKFVAKIKSEVDEVFSNMSDNPLMLALKTLVIKKLIADGPNGRLDLLRNATSELEE